ncbi:MAG: hypothetical protein R2856_34200 [Caldilineaceae bacterium]
MRHPQVLVRIENITISDNTSDGCTVGGAMTITTNGSTVSSIPFSGVVNARDQFSDTSIRISRLTGLPLVARGVEVTYINENPASTSSARCYKCLRSLAASLEYDSAPTFIDSGGIRIQFDQHRSARLRQKVALR